MKWIVETKGKDGAWKAFGYAQDEQAAREKAAKACVYAKLIHMVRFRRNLDD